METIPNGSTVPRKWPRYRPRAVDKRTRADRIWAERRAALVEAMGQTPSAAEDELLDVLTDRLIAVITAGGPRVRWWPGIGRSTVTC